MATLTPFMASAAPAATTATTLVPASTNDGYTITIRAVNKNTSGVAKIKIGLSATTSFDASKYIEEYSQVTRGIPLVNTAIVVPPGFNVIVEADVTDVNFLATGFERS